MRAQTRDFLDRWGRVLIIAAFGSWLIALLIAFDEGYVLYGLFIFALLPLSLLAKRNRQAAAIKKDKIRDAETEQRTRWPARVGPHLLSDEFVRWEGRLHPSIVLKWWALFYTSPMIAVLATMMFRSPTIGFGLFLVVAALSSWHIYTKWWLDWVAVTNVRILKVEGLFNTRVPTMPLQKLVNVTGEEPFASKLLVAIGFTGFTHITLETAGEVEAIPSLRFVPSHFRVIELLSEPFTRMDRADGT